MVEYHLDVRMLLMWSACYIGIVRGGEGWEKSLLASQVILFITYLFHTEVQKTADKIIVCIILHQ